MGRRPAPSSLASLSVAAIHAELRRRQKSVKPLQRKKEKLLAKVALIDAQIAGLGGSVGSAGSRTRPQNSVSLVSALATVLKSKTMGVSEAAEAVQKSGYTSNAANFRTIVNQTLIKNRQTFKKVGRGQYTAA